MAKLITIEAKDRAQLGSSNSRRLRWSGFTPAVLYGREQETLHLAFDTDELLRSLRQHARVLDVQLPGGGTQPAMIKDLQIDAVTDEVLHLDLNRVDLTEKQEFEVEIKYVGDCRGVVLGGHLETNKHSVRVSATVADVPENIRLDLSQVGLDELIRVGDLKLPEGVSALDDAEEVVVVCKPATEEVEAAEGEATGNEPEVISKGKKDKEED
ncbi:MAG: 50S ribosomal protein L25 [Planctomycetota bacterium]|jgi:large subunit ribosomal protein L25